MSIKGFKVNNSVEKYDYNALENLPEIFPKNGLKNQVLTYDGKGNVVWKTISNIFLGDRFLDSDIPDYVREAAVQLSEKVRAAQTSNTITFIAISDSHHLASQTHSWAELTNSGNLHAIQAIKILKYACKIDFACHLGDYTFGHTTTTKEQLEEQVTEINSWLDEALDGIPNIRSVGNHDTGEYGSELTGSETIFELIGSHCSSGVVFGSTEFGYGYVDLPDKKIRMINLNTCEGETVNGENAEYAMSNDQLLWLANTLLDIGDKSDWMFCIFGHYPLDYGWAYSAGNVLYAYLNGESITIGETTVDYTQHNLATFVAEFHGHLHNFKVDNIHHIVNGSGTPMDAKRLATPNSAFYRNNQYNDNGAPDSWGIEFGESTTYEKTRDTAKDTAFVVNVINPDEHTIFSYCYGAGYDRAVSYSGAAKYYSISYDTYKAVVDNDTTFIGDGESYTATVSPAAGNTLRSVTVTMGGTDITSSVYSNGRISISEVTGNIVITATGYKPGTFTNKVSTSVDINNNIYNSVGYKDRARITSSGAEEDNFSHHAVTGFIPYSIGDTIRIGGKDVTWEDYGCMIYPYAADKTACRYGVAYNHVNNTTFGEWSTEENSVVVFKFKDTYLTQNGFSATDGGYIRVSARTEDGSDLIVTINQEIDGEV